jgi:hypothetical protein
MKEIPLVPKAEDRGQKTEDRIGKPGNQDNRVKVISRSGN